jgi:hypothetical protein
MSADIAKELEELFAELPAHQKQALKELFKTGEVAEKPKSKGKNLADTGLHICEVQLCCKLCGTVEKVKMKSSSSLPSKMHIPTCNSCRSVLQTFTIEALIETLIEVAEGTYADLKRLKGEVKPSPMPEKREEKERDDYYGPVDSVSGSVL